MTEIVVQIQERGRITIPVNIRKRYDLKDGDWITLELVLDDQSRKTESRKNPAVAVIETEKEIDLEESIDMAIQGTRS